MRQRARWAEFVGVGYLFLALLITLNVVLVAWGSPLPRWASLLDEQGATGLALLAWTGVAVWIVAALRGQLTNQQWQIIAAVTVWCGLPALSLLLHGSIQDSRFWLVAVVAPSIAVAGGLIGAGLLRMTLFGLGWVFGWGSVAAALSDLLFGWPSTLATGDARYGRWLASAGIKVGDVAYLNGLTPGRIFLGMTCAVLFVYVVRVLPVRPVHWWMWLMPAGLLFAAGWSFARVGWVAILVGLVASLVRWERLRVVWLWIAMVVVAMTPLVVSRFVVANAIGDGTTQWRFELWDKYLGTPQVLGPFGVGPQAPPDQITGHAHQQFLETQATGGWLALSGLLAFLALGGLACRAAARLDNRAGIAALFATVALFQVDIVTFAPTFSVLNNAFILIVAIVTSTAGAVNVGSTSAQSSRTALKVP